MQLTWFNVFIVATFIGNFSLSAAWFIIFLQRKALNRINDREITLGNFFAFLLLSVTNIGVMFDTTHHLPKWIIIVRLIAMLVLLNSAFKKVCYYWDVIKRLKRMKFIKPQSI